MQEILQSVQRVTVTGRYVTYHIPEGERLTRGELTRHRVEEVAGYEDSFEHTKAGTAIILSADNDNITLLTTAHTLNFSESIVTYREQTGQTSTAYVESVSFLEGRNNRLYADPDIGGFDILAMDEYRDLALLSVEPDHYDQTEFADLEVPMGNAEELEWGTFVYVFGYPKGVQMVSRALVSEPERSPQYSFVLDAVFNPGFSGGIIMALRDGVPNFEWVGMVQAASADRRQVLTPDDEAGADYPEGVAFENEIFVEHVDDIHYGITMSISSNRIRDFFEEHEALLESNDVPVSKILK